MDHQGVASYITDWLRSYAEKSRVNGFVVGISGGIDSALTSTLCARTGLPTWLLEMPIYQAPSQVSRAQEHIAWLRRHYPGVRDARIELTPTFDAFMAAVPAAGDEDKRNLALANTRARLRMTTLYYFAGMHGLLVAGTGNKVEDFGVGFFTKYGDGGVDLSPIADLKKTEVYGIARHLGIVPSILQAAPTDGLWGDDRTDEDQIGASYPELEWAMDYLSNSGTPSYSTVQDKSWGDVLAWIQQQGFSEQQQRVMSIYLARHRANRHKMDPIPVCILPGALR